MFSRISEIQVFSDLAPYGTQVPNLFRNGQSEEGLYSREHAKEGGRQTQKEDGSVKAKEVQATVPAEGSGYGSQGGEGEEDDAWPSSQGIPGTV